MKEHGLLLSSGMVRAYMAGRKTMTRRVMTPNNTSVDGQPLRRMPYGRTWDDFDFDAAYVDDSAFSVAGNPGPFLKVPLPYEGTVHRFYPVYEVGDGIWWRETWQAVSPTEDWLPLEECKIIYRATDKHPGFDLTEYAQVNNLALGYEERMSDPIYPWRPSIHMPKSVCRNRSTITARRPERVQDISATDCFKEGIKELPSGMYENPAGLPVSHAYHNGYRDFCVLWDSINLKRGYGWDVNFWNWVLEFKRIKA